MTQFPISSFQSDEELERLVWKYPNKTNFSSDSNLREKIGSLPKNPTRFVSIPGSNEMVLEYETEKGTYYFSKEKAPTLKEVVNQASEKLGLFNIQPMLSRLRYLNEGAMNDVLNTNGCAYYQWTPGLLEILKPKQIVELGGAMGVWDLMVLNGSYQDFDLYSITLPENGLEFSYVKENYPNFHPIVGDDLDLSNWERMVTPPEKFNYEAKLKETDLWFFDAEHTPEQLQKEFDLYSPFFKKGAFVLVDDIRSFGLWPIWEKLPYEKIEITDPCHYSGFGIVRI